MLEGAEFRDRAIYLGEERTLVLADLHVGRDRASALSLPLGEHDDLHDRLDGLLDRFSPERVVLAGDLLHSYGTVPEEVRESVTDILSLIDRAGATSVVTPGNHDAMLGAVFDGESPECYRIGEVAICHGHRKMEADAPLTVLGHDHPAIRIEGRKRPCYLLGPRSGGEGRALVLPAFNRLTRGVDVSRSTSFLSPLLADPGTYRPIVRDEEGDETLAFPPLSRLRRLL
ncbi:metallophosphoesterase [Natronorarus salvus]|uniref:metallophosphoesterase n=1 Tax=Natronorarus salvus TaxID=3117733 RepID=UPI002F262E5B